MMPVMADPTQLEVAVLNLAINARDAMPDGGILSFSSRPLRVRGDPEIADGDYIELTIADTGVGMPPEVAERAFEPFFTTKEVGKGTGLGLSMVYGMARQSGGGAADRKPRGRRHRGQAAVPQGRQGRGRGRRAAPTKPPLRPDPPSPQSVLVIDDDPDVRGFIVERWRSRAIRSARRATGAPASIEIKHNRPDLVVLDFIMPGLSGAEVASRIRAEAAQPADPVRVRL